MRPLPASILVALGLTAATPAPATDSAGTTGDTAPVRESGDTGKVSACLCGCDYGDVGVTLVVPAIAAIAARRRSRREILDDLAQRGVLSPDLAARLRT